MLCFGSLFRCLYVRSLWSAATSPKNTRKCSGQRDLLVSFGFFSRLQSSRQKGARRGGRRPRSLRQSRGRTPLHGAAHSGSAECVGLLLNTGAEKARRRRSQGGFGRVRRGGGGGSSFKGQEGVERCRKQGVPSIPHRIPSLGIQNRRFTDSIQWPLSTCLATF